MEKAITMYAKRDILGRFKPSRKQVYKVSFVVLTFASLALNWVLFRTHYDIRCRDIASQGIIGGLIVSKEACADLNQARFDSIELSREKSLQSLNQ